MLAALILVPVDQTNDDCWQTLVSSDCHLLFGPVGTIADTSGHQWGTVAPVKLLWHVSAPERLGRLSCLPCFQAALENCLCSFGETAPGMRRSHCLLGPGWLGYAQNFYARAESLDLWILFWREGLPPTLPRLSNNTICT